MDPATCAALHELQMEHLELLMDVQMDTKRISSVATLHMKRCGASPVTTLQLDVFHLTIHAVEVVIDGADDEHASSVFPIEWSVKSFTSFGEILAIQLPHELESAQTFRLVVRYETDPESPAVCWLEKEQTAGKTHPFMYTQGQEVLNRSFFPCQDSPSVRITYDATVTVPSELVCVMSAKQCGARPVVDSDGSTDSSRKQFVFEMKQSIPVYLVAMAVGDLVSAEVGPRSSVWTESCMLEASKNEFSGILDKYLTIGERLFGDYLWERYDVLVMPPSFPYGGMENPRLTFVSPCLITGDQSLCSIIAHEISHSWFGNLVTNASWSDFFLNEGFTMYAERRIIEKAHGRPLMNLTAKIGEALLRNEISALGESDPLTRLRVPLETGIDPGDCYNHCAYEKGYAFVCYLRHLVGSDDVFDRFLREYSLHFKFQSIAAEEMMAYFLSYFPDLADGSEVKGPVKFSTWLHEPGYPHFSPDFSDAKPMMDACESLAYYWRSADVPVQANVIYLSQEAKTWPVFQLLYFLDLLMEVSLSHTDVVIELGNALDLWNSTNSEVLYRWSHVLIKNEVNTKLDFVTRFMAMQGKQKFQIPVYRALVASSSPVIQQLAKDIYHATRPTLHVMVRDRIEALLKTIQ
ncbi:hypothetical protein Poli38472_006052 [Pythium oligandrum]|uniref:Peptidase M1 leukotriene A4 hydrolase/aminopeptidase C-terminal domain-containing protein n=1 Tax=Pythium oligandrum TaxID=41045 RepID=A0A8K1CST4_PYTOL|nr:hypothetical protein Poli38472_006052 [Pythium oligandrum]|eukprot:TMW68584.1 hypothetical protein Poli38472_006052 [Pythium oligandrum]